MKMKAYCFVLAVLWAIGITPSLAEESDHDHEHGEHFKQAAVYNMTAGSNSLIIIPVGGTNGFDEEAVAFMVVSATSADEEGLEGAETTTEEVWEAYEEDPTTATTLSSGDTASPSLSTVYEVVLEDPLVQVTVEITDYGAYALFIEHGSDEVLAVVTSSSGDVVTAGATEGVDEHDDHDDHEDEEDHEDHEDHEDEADSSPATAAQWGEAIGASVIVSLCSMAGLVILASGCVSRKVNLSYACFFAAGALLTASFLHIIPEALEPLASEFDNNLHDMGISAGVATLGGISLGVILHIVFETTEHSDGDMNQATSQSSADGSNDNIATLEDMMEARKDKALTDVKGWHPGSWNIIIGDFVHNFADGVAIGAAFLGCSSTVGWIVTASIVIHEVPQELADFLALVNGGMSKTQAFVFNFLSAISAILGAVAILALRETLSSADVSYILFVGAGTFIFIALGELIPEGLKGSPSTAGATSSVWRTQAFKLLSFLLGAGIIGVSLIFDEHCDAGHHGHDH